MFLNSQIFCNGYNQVSQMHPQKICVQCNISWQRRWTLPKQSLIPAVPYFGKEKLLTLALEVKVLPSRNCSFVYYGSVGQNKGHRLSVLNYPQNVTAMLYFAYINGRLKLDCHKKEMAGLVLYSNYSQLDKAFCLSIACRFTEGKKVQGIFPFPL